VDAGCQVALAAVPGIEDLDLADERVVRIEVGKHVGEPGCRLGLGEGHVDALAEQEAPQVGVVDLFCLAGVCRGAGVELVALEPLDATDVAFQNVEDAAFRADPFFEVAEQGPEDALGELPPHLSSMLDWSLTECA
jgi:hypothetical protein